MPVRRLTVLRTAVSGTMRGRVFYDELSCPKPYPQLVTEITKQLELPVPPYQVSVERCGAARRLGTATAAAARVSSSSSRHICPFAAPVVTVTSGFRLLLGMERRCHRTQLVTVAAAPT